MLLSQGCLNLDSEGFAMMLRVELRALLDCPVWEKHSRGKNWCASISKNPQAIGGIGREFWEKARGDYYYMVPTGLKPGTPLEFGADYHSSGGRKTPKRFFCVVESITESSLNVKSYPTAREAIEAAKCPIGVLTDLPKSRIDELRLQLTKMQKIVDEFSISATKIGNIQFATFADLMNDYIQICTANFKIGIDFTKAGVHTGLLLKVRPHQLKCIREKISCIFEIVDIVEDLPSDEI